MEDGAWYRLVRAVGRELADGDITEPELSNDINEVRESLARHRAVAAAERQCHSARAVLIDVEVGEDGSARIVVATPSGDRREDREALADAITLFGLASKGATQDLGHAAIVAFLFPWLLDLGGAARAEEG